RCLLMSLVISNMSAWALPKISRRAASALMSFRFASSCSLPFLMYSQTFLTTSVRGSGLSPTIDASAALGVSAFMKAALGLRAFLAAGFLAAFLAAAFLAAGFFAAAFLAAGFLAAGFFAGAFFAAGFLAAAFLAAGFLAGAFFAAGFLAAFLAVAILDPPESMSAMFVSNSAVSEGKRALSTGAK